MSICSYVIPAGSYERIFNETANRKVMDPNSFTYVEQSPVSFFSFLHAIPNGMVEVADIMVFIFVVGGAFNIITQTGATENGIKKLAYRLQGREKIIIPMMMFVFSLGGATFGMSEETIISIPIGIALARALGYDAIVGMAMVTFGAAIGFASGFLMWAWLRRSQNCPRSQVCLCALLCGWSWWLWSPCASCAMPIRSGKIRSSAMFGIWSWRKRTRRLPLRMYPSGHGIFWCC